MAVYTSNSVTPVTDTRLRPRIPVEKDPGLWETINAGFRQENSLVSAASTGFGIRPEFKPLDGYIPEQDIKGFEKYSDTFTDSRSPAETTLIKMQITQELKDQETLRRSGVSGIVAQMAAGLTDPIYLPLMFLSGGIEPLIRGGSLLKGALVTGVVFGSAEATAEGVKHLTQNTRTTERSLINIGGAALTAGVLHGAAKGLSKIKFKKIAQEVSRHFTDDAAVTAGEDLFQQSLLNHKVDPITFGLRTALLHENELVSTGIKLEKLPVSPLVRLLNSKSLRARQITQDLLENPLLLYKNIEGRTGVPMGGSVETRIKQWNTPLAKATQVLDAQFTKYRKGLIPGVPRLTRRQFRQEVGKAMRRGTSHPVPEVKIAAKVFRKELFDPLKDAAVELKLLPDTLSKNQVSSYLTRVYKPGVIKANRPEWTNKLVVWLQREQHALEETAPYIGGLGPDARNFVEASKTELLDMSEQITDHILGVSDGRIPYEAVPLVRGPLKERVLTIPDKEIEKFLESDISVVARHYKNTVASDVEMVRRFGSRDMESQIQEVLVDFNQQIREAKTPKIRLKLEASKTRTIRDLEATRDKLLGRYLSPKDPDNYFVRANRIVRDVNFLRMLGGMTPSAIPDLARPIMTQGIRPFAKVLKTMILSPQKFKIALEDAKPASVAWEMVLNSRAKSLAEIGEEYQSRSAGERLIESATDISGKVFLMSQWNNALKQFSGLVIADRILTDVTSEVLSKTATAKLARTGISRSLTVRIAKQFTEFGEDGSLKLMRGDRWTDKEAWQTMRSAVLQDVDRAIVTPGVGEAPLWMSTPMGKLAGQFKAFAVSAHHKVLVADLQMVDAAALNGFLLSVGLGAMTYGFKQVNAGRKLPDDPVQLTLEALDRSGVFGFMWDVNNTLEKVTKGNAGISAAFGNPQLSRYRTKNMAGALVGPTADTIQDVTTLSAAIAKGELTAKDIRAIRKLIPFQNVFYMRQLFDRIETKAKETLTTR